MFNSLIYAHDSVVVVIDTMKVLQIQPSPVNSLKEWLPLLIALLAVFWGPLITLRLGNRQSKNQLEMSQNQIKANVLSSNRQQWIHILRDQLAELNSIVISLMFHREGLNSIVKLEDIPNKISKSFYLASKIKLLLNPEKPLQRDLQEKIENVMNLVGKEDADIKKVTAAIDEVNTIGQKLFEDTWHKIKELR